VFLDISQEMIKRAQQRLAESSTKIKYMNVDFLQNNLESNSFDNIISIRNLEYFSDKKAFLNETYRLLKKNGNLLLITKNPTYSSNVSNRKLLHTSQINIDDLLQMLISCGYKIKCIHPAIFGKLFRFSLFRGLFSLIHRIINLLPIGMTRSKTLSYLSESFLVYAEK
jgi:ubiquinone/menaquinone biosynthesis C-methylase UbiE